MGEADQAIADEDWPTAEEKLQQAIDIAPDNPLNVLLLSNLGMVRFSAGQAEEAIATLNHAHMIAPRSVTVLKNRAKIYMALNRLEDAYADYSTIIELDSAAVEPRFYHGMLAMRQADLTTALADFSRLEEIAPEDPLTNLGLATYYNSLADYGKAAQYFSLLIEQEPTAEYYGARGVCYLYLDRLNEASADINEALRLNPADAELYVYRAALNKLRFRDDDAREDALRAVELGVDPRRVAPILK